MKDIRYHLALGLVFVLVYGAFLSLILTILFVAWRFGSQ